MITWKGEMEWDASDIAQVHGKRIRWKGNDGWVSLSATSIVAYFSTEATIPIFLFFFLTFFVAIVAADNGRILMVRDVSWKNIILQHRCTEDNYCNSSECYRLPNRLLSTGFDDSDTYLLRKLIRSPTIIMPTIVSKLCNQPS